MLGVVTGLVTGSGELGGLVDGTVMGVVEGTVDGVEPGFSGVIAAGLVAGMVIMVGVGFSDGVVMTGVVNIGVVGKTVGGFTVSCNIVVRWDLLRSSLWEEGKISFSSLLSPSCANFLKDNTSTYNPAICPKSRVLFSKDFNTLSLN